MMDSTQKKTRRLSFASFVITWTLLHVVIGGIVGYLNFSIGQALFIDGMSSMDWLVSLTLPFLAVLPLAFAQKRLLRFGFGLELRGWLRAGLAAVLVMQVLNMTFLPLLYTVITASTAAIILPILSTVMYALPASLTQWFVLRQHLQGAWSWIPATVIGSVLVQFFSLYQWLALGNIEIGVPSLWIPLLTSISLIWMLKQSQPGEQQAQMYNAETNLHTARQRLAHIEPSSAPISTHQIEKRSASKS